MSNLALDLESELDDEVVAARVVAGDTGLFAVLVRRHNQRLFRAARAVLSHDADAEDALQQAWIAAFRKLSSFERRSRLSTWLTRIAVREAIARRRMRSRLQAVGADAPASAPGPEDLVARREIAKSIEDAIDRLPDAYRTVFVLRDVQQMSTAEVAEALELSEVNVRVRLHRGRDLMRASLGGAVDPSDVHAFAGRRCARMLAVVMSALSPPSL